MRLVLMYSLAAPGRHHVQRLKSISPDLEIIPVQSEAEAMDAVPEADAILGHRYLSQAMPFAKKLRWVQTSAAGVDRLPLEELARRQIVLTRSTLDSEIVAAHSVGLAWALARAIPDAVKAQQERQWNRDLNFGVMPRHALVFGQGLVGRAIARRLRAQAIRVTGVVRHEIKSGEPVECDEIISGSNWRTVLSEVDWCFLAVNYNSENHHLFNESALRSLSKHAVLVNVGRGETLDTNALMRVLEQGHLSGVGLDVMEDEPLPMNHPLWNAPRILLTPHVAAHHPERIEKLEHFFESQVSRFLSGESLENVVDLSVP